MQCGTGVYLGYTSKSHVFISSFQLLGNDRDLNSALCDILLSGGMHYVETGRPCHFPYLLIYRPKAEMVYSIISSSLCSLVMGLECLGLMITGWRDCLCKLFSFISQSSEVFVTVAWNWPPSWGSVLGTRTQKRIQILSL